MSESKIKTMLICFFDIGCISQFESVPEGSTVNQTFYMKRLIDAVKCKRGELWRDHSLFLHHNKSLAHSSLQVSQFLAGKGISAMDHPPYSPDLAPSDFRLHTERKVFLRH
jgi:histone-lysine N-methyltransferase SETMAR